jgi:NAD(P)-dependent dehydrogenase (short-subunit alcohol dehydrogenase family)
MFNLTGKRALVTGSTQGIGYEIARVLRAYGAEVYIHCSRDEVKARAIAAELQSDLWVTGDLGDSECVKRIFEKTGALDIVVANASVQFRTPWNEISAEEFDRQINVNLRSTLELMQSYVPAMQAKKWGRFLAVGSVQQYRPHMHMAVYAASKCAIQSLVHNVAKQVAKDGVTVNSLVPGVIATPRNNEALSDAEYAKAVLSGIPAGFAGQPSDCAGAALLLCSDAGRYITGIELPVDGGMKL